MAFWSQIWSYLDDLKRQVLNFYRDLQRKKITICQKNKLAKKPYIFQNVNLSKKIIVILPTFSPSRPIWATCRQIWATCRQIGLLFATFWVGRKVAEWKAEFGRMPV